MRTLRWSPILLLAAGCAHLSTGASFFHVERKNQFTFGHSGTLVAGDRVNLKFVKLSPNDGFLINKCGTPCNTSKVVFYIEGKELAQGERSFEVKEDGTYYFWIQRTLDSGEAGPSHIDKFDAEGMRFKATFMTSSIVFGDLERRPN